jgi:hypothetical protein
MPQMAFFSEQDITEMHLDYMANEVESLSELGDLDIENYGDREILNPDVDDVDEPTDIDDDEAEEEELVLGTAEAMKVERPRKRKFKKFKRKARKILCSVLDGLGDDDGLDLKKLLQGALAAAIPAFSGLPVFVSIIIVSLVALFLRRGYNRVCPA